jgi:CHAT domain-containing protein
VSSLLIAALSLFPLVQNYSPVAYAEDAATVKAPDDDRATRAFGEAEVLRASWEKEAMLQAVQKYEEAAAASLKLSPGTAAEALREAGDLYFIFSDYQQALAYYNRSLEIIKGTGHQVEELKTLNSIGYAYIYLSENQKALRYATRVSKESKRLPPSVGDPTRYSLEARAINSIGEIYYAFGDLKGSLKMFTQALDLWGMAQERRGMALAHLNLGYSYTDTGNLQEATGHYHQALALWQEIGDRRGEALTSTALGSVHSYLGDKQLALDSHMGAIALFRLMGNYQGEAAAINGVAQAYEDLSDYPKALENYKQALDLYRMIGNLDFVALNKYYIGRVYFSMSEGAQARTFYQQALELSRRVGDRQIEAHILKGLGILDSSEGNNTGALRQFLKVLNLHDRVGDRKGKAYALNSIGHLYYTTGARQQALSYFRQALPLIRATEDRRGEALTLYNIARVERDDGNLNGALSHIKESIAIIEASRAKVDSKDLRTSYFAQAHQHYELYIDLLMQLDRQQPASGYSAEAFLASERARARSLLDMLTEGNLDLGAGSNDGLLKLERELAQLLNAKTEYRTRLLSDHQMQAEANQVAEDIRTLAREYEAVRDRIREQNPRYAAITQPARLSVQEIQSELRAGDTLLLEFSLGDERSYLWAVSPDSVEGYELPGRAIIESAADHVYALLAARRSAVQGQASERGKLNEASESDYQREAAALSWTLLGPVAAQLGAKRLLIVTDGMLHYIPFEALPVPKPPAGPDQRPTFNAQDNEAQLLIDDHEIVALPSASILAAIRREKVRPPAPPAPAAKTVAVLADPVFDKDDPRVQQASTSAESPPPSQKVEDSYLQRALRTFDGDGAPSNIPRLPASLKEAKAIMAVTPRSEGTMAVGFEASRARIMSEELKNYRIIHFATHGILDSEHPEMSGLILSMVDREGHAQDGYLRLHDIYGLDVRADLVVLSACRTGLGRSVQGEGLIGLTRGFMYAGSKSVVASLWKVDDEATAELMKNFYTYMLRDGLTPAAALRAAQQAIRATGRWRSPYFWAGFVLHGEYNETFVPAQDGAHFPYAAHLLIACILTTALFLLWRRRRRLQRCRYQLPSSPTSDLSVNR